MAGPLYHIGRFCSRHFKLVIAVWIAATIGVAFAGNLAGGHTSDDLSLPGTGSTKASDVLAAHLPDQAYGGNPLVLKATHGKLTDSNNAKAVERDGRQRAGYAARDQGGQPTLGHRLGFPLEGQEDGLYPSDDEREPE